jgi:hypothetical protein
MSPVEFGIAFLAVLWILVGWSLARAAALGDRHAARTREPAPDMQERAAQATTRPHAKLRDWPYGGRSKW